MVVRPKKLSDSCLLCPKLEQLIRTCSDVVGQAIGVEKEQVSPECIYSKISIISKSYLGSGNKQRPASLEVPLVRRKDQI